MDLSGEDDPDDVSVTFSDVDEDEELTDIWIQIQQGQYEKISKLPLSKLNIDRPSLDLVIELLEFTDCKLETLDLSYNNLGFEEALLLGAAFTKNVSLTVLDVSCNPIGDEGIKSIAPSLEMRESNFSAVKELNLRDCNITEEGIKALSAAIFGNSSLEMLNLSGNILGNEGASALAKVIGGGVGSSALTYLVLANSQIGPEGGCALGRAIARGMAICLTLEEVYLGGCSLSNEGAGAIAGALKKCRNLTTLGLNCNFIEDDGAVMVFRALEENVELSLRELIIHDNQIRSNGAVGIGTALGSNISIVNLSLAGNKFDEEGITAIADGLSTNQQLLTLDLSRCHLNDRCAEILAKSIDETNQTLVSLLLDNNLFCKKTKYEVEYALSRQRKGVRDILHDLTKSPLQAGRVDPLPSVPQTQSESAPIKLPPVRTQSTLRPNKEFASLSPTEKQKVSVSLGREANVIGHIFATVRTSLADARQKIDEIGVSDEYQFLNHEGNIVPKEDEENRLVLLDCGMSIKLRPSGWIEIL